MTDASLKTAGYIQLKLIHADRNAQTWSGWSRRWVELFVVSDDSGQSKREKIPEVWLQARKSKRTGKPIKIWTIDSKNTVVHGCFSKTKPHAFAIQYKEEDIVYLSGNSAVESYDWMKTIREFLRPTNKIVELEVASGRSFEASVIENSYSERCGLFGQYGQLLCRGNKLILFDNDGVNVIQEWYLHTIRKLQVFDSKKSDAIQRLSIHLGEHSSTGCGVACFYCPQAVSLLESIQTNIRDIFNDLGDDRKAQQATLMSLGALHDVILEEPDTKGVEKTLIISEEIIKAKQDASQSGILMTTSHAVHEATKKDEPFIWKDNELYEQEAVSVSVKADYTPPDEQPPKKPQRASLTMSLGLMRRPRASSSCNPESAALEPTNPQSQRIPSKLPRKGKHQLKSIPAISKKQFALQVQRFQNVLNLEDPENSEQMLPVSANSKNPSPSGDLRRLRRMSELSTLGKCSKETAPRSASLASIDVPTIVDFKLAVTKNTEIKDVSVKTDKNNTNTEVLDVGFEPDNADAEVCSSEAYGDETNTKYDDAKSEYDQAKSQEVFLLSKKRGSCAVNVSALIQSYELHMTPADNNDGEKPELDLEIQELSQDESSRNTSSDEPLERMKLPTNTETAQALETFGDLPQTETQVVESDSAVETGGHEVTRDEVNGSSSPVESGNQLENSEGSVAESAFQRLSASPNFPAPDGISHVVKINSTPAPFKPKRGPVKEP